MPNGPVELDALHAIAKPVIDNRLLTQWDFGWLWWGQLVSQVGDGVTRLALLWYVYSVTGSAVQTTVIGLLQTLPPVIFGPLIGVYLDRLPKKAIMIASDLLRAVIIGLVPCVVPVEALKVDHLFVLVFLNSIASTIFGPALISSVPFIVPRAQFTAANALLQITSSLGVIAGSTLSGIGIAALSSQKVLCVNAVTYVVSAACLLFVRIPHIATVAHTTRSELQSMITDLIEGVRYAFVKQQVILDLIIAAALYSFGMSAFSTLFPILGKTMLGLGPAEIGYMWSSLGIGLFVVSLALIRMSDWTVSGRITAIAVSSVLTAVAMCALILTSNRVIAGILLCLIGTGIGLFTPVAWGVLQEIAPQGMVGRLLTLYGAAAMAAAMVGMTFLSWIMQKVGESIVVLAIGFVLLLTAGMAWRLSRRVMSWR
jgi:DHA3 family macrolide efflux protein-like MFS transporter